MPPANALRRDAVDPVLAAIERAPMGEPLSPEESEAVAEGMRAIVAGRTVPHAQVADATAERSSVEPIG